MYFTQEDYKKIENWLHRNSVKDTEFQEALPFTGTELVTVVQDGHNRKVNIQEFINQLYKHGVEDFLNVTNTYRANNITLKEAINLIPAEARKEGQVITFLNTEGNWEIYQFTGKLNQWNNTTLWDNPFDWEKFIIDSILPDEEDLTKSVSDAKGNTYLSLKDRKYEPDKYSGLGRKILRRRVVEIEDPIYGTQEKNLLLQADFAEDNTVYVVRYDFTLNGQDITLPDNSYIEYEGGSISDGNIIDRAGGLNRVALKKNIVNGKNILTQEMVSTPNTIYEIRYDFTLSENVTIPANCVLKFNGGSISGNSVLLLSNTEITGSPKIRCILDGIIKNDDVYIDWFINAASSDSNLENASQYIQGGFNVKPKRVIFNKGYYTLNDIVIKADVEIIGRETTIIPVEIDQNTYNFHFFKNVFNANVNLVTPQLVDNGVRNVAISGFTFIGKGCGTFDGQLDQRDYYGDPVIHISTANNVIIENCVFKDVENAVRTRSWPNGNYGTYAGILISIWDVNNTIIRNIEQTNCRGDEQIFVSANHEDIYKTSVVYENNYAHDMRPGINSSIFTTVCGNLLFKNNYVNNWNYGGSAFNLFGRNVTIEGNIVENSWCSSVFDTCEYGYFYNDKVVCIKNTVKVKNSIMLLYQSKVADIRDNIFYGMIACRSVNNPTGYGTYPYFYLPSNPIQTDIATKIENNVFDCTNYDNTIAAPSSQKDYRTGAIISTGSYSNIGNNSSAINISPIKMKAGNVLINNNKIKILENIPSNDPNHLYDLYPTPIFVRNLDKLTVMDNTFDGVYRTYGINHGTIISVYNYPDEMDNFIPRADGESMESFMSNNKELLTYKEYSFIDNIINSTTYTTDISINAFYCFWRDSKHLPLIIDSMQVIHQGVQRIFPVESYNNVVVINGVYNGNLYYGNNIAINLIADVYDDETYDIKTIGRLKRFAQYLDKDNNKIIIPSIRGGFYEKSYSTITEGTRINKGEQFFTPSGYIYKNLSVVVSYDSSAPFPQPEQDLSNYTEFMYIQHCWWYKIGIQLLKNYRYVALTSV